MNRIYSLVWSAARGMWIVAHEKAAARGKCGGVRKRGGVSALVLGLAGGWCAPSALAAEVPPPAPSALPQGAVVAAGTAQIGSPSANQLQINQSSANAVINWNSFDIGAQSKVQFVQPNAASRVLNRVLASDPTQIHGQLSANGQVYIVNPNGIVFGKGARVDVGALAASTLDSSDDDFMAGRNRFTRGAAGGSVVNHGSLNAAPGGYVALLGANVNNSGTIHTPGGTTLLAAGAAVQLPLTPGGLVTLELSPASVNAVVSNSGEGLVSAPDGQVYMSAAAAGSAAAQAFNHGTIDVSSASAGGGRVTLQGKQVGLMDGSRILATGATGGGTVQVGGAVHDMGPGAASAVHVGQHAAIDASATGAGNGGTVTLWSRDYTGFYGQIKARGGAQGGDGGFVDTSSRNNLQAFGLVDASAPLGKAGNWLLDPTDVTIVAGGTNVNDTYAGGVFTPTTDSAQIGVDNINTNLNLGTSITIETASAGAAAGNITQNAGANIVKTLAGVSTLTMNAAGAITLNGNITSTIGSLNTTLNAAGGGVGGTANIALNGGLLTVNNSGAGTLSGIISGSGGLTQAGTGTTTLTGANTYTGATTVNAGMLQVGNGGITGAIAGASNVTIAAPAIMKWNNNNAAATVNIANLISGAGSLVFQGQNSLAQPGRSAFALTGNNSGFTGNLAINAARLTGTSGNNFGAGTIAIQAGGQLFVNGGLTLPQQITIENNAGWWDNASTNYGAMRTGGTNTFSGNLILNDTTTMVAGSTTGLNSTITALTAGNTTFSGVISGPGGFKMSRFSGTSGAANVAFTGTSSNTYAGTTVVDGQAGNASLQLNKSGGAVAIPANTTVQFGNATASAGNLRMLANNQFGAGAVLNFVNTQPNWGRFQLLGTTQTLAGVNSTSTGAVIENSGIGVLQNTTGTLILNGAGSYTYTATMRNTDTAGGGVLNLVHSGTGSQTLSGTGIAYAGSTTVSAGQLLLNQTTGYISPTTVSGGARLSLTGSAAYTVPAAATFALDSGAILENLNPNNFTVLSGAVTVSGSATINQSSNATNASGRGFYLDGGLKGSGTVTINALNAGSAVSLRNNNSTFAGAMTVNGIANSTPFAGSGLAVAGCTVCLQNVDITLNGTMELNNQGIGWSNSGGGQFTMGALSGTGVLVSTSIIGTTSLRLGNTGNSGLFSGSIVNSGNGTLTLTKNGAGTQVLTGTSNHKGTTTINAGTLQVGNGGTTGAIGAGAIVNNGNLVFHRSNAITLPNTISGTGNLTATSGANLTMNGTVNLGGNVLLTAGEGQPVAPASVPNGSVTGGDVTLNAAVTAGGAGKLTIYSGNATTAAYTARIAGSASSLNKAYATATYNGTVDPAKTLNVFYRVAPTLSANITANDKVYDGTTGATINAATTTVTGIDGDSMVLTGATGNFADANAGSGKTVTFSDITVANPTAGVTISGYQPLPATTTTTATIAQAALTVRANNDAKFITQTDNPGFAGASYSGFVNGENTSVLGGTLGVNRSNAGVEAAGSYAGVLLPSGLSAANYSFNYVPGDFTIVPANELLVRLGSTTSTYGAAASYGIQSAQYMLPNGTIVDLAAAVNSGVAAVDDGAGGIVSFPILALNPLLSGSGNLSVGGYQLGAGSVSGNSANFSNNLTVTGNQSVNPLAISLGVGAVSKVYDGTTALAAALSLPGLIASDAVTVSGSGAYAGKNAGTNLAYTVSGLAMSGADSANYVLNGGAGTYYGYDGVITPAALTLTATGSTKTYDGTASSTALPTVSGLYGTDTVTGLTVSYDTRHAGTGKTMSVDAGYIINDGNGGNNYTVSLVSDSSGIITPAALTLTASANAKTYDGTTVATAAPTVSGLLGNDIVSNLSQAYTSPTAGTGKTLSVTGYLLDDGNGGGNYAVSLVDNTNGVIDKAALTVVAGNDSKFVTQADAAGYGGFVYRGFVNGETASVLGGTPTITRSNAGVNTAGFYDDVLLGSGFTSDNYAISYVAGDYTIVPANELLLKMGNTTTTYGDGFSTVLNVQSAQYVLSDGTLVNLAASSDASGTVTVDDGHGNLVAINVAPDTTHNGGFSGAFQLKAGQYQLLNAGVTGSSANFSNNVVVTGTRTVNPLAITLGVGGVSKVYNANTAMNNLSLSLNGALDGSGDSVFASGTGLYDGKNVGTGLGYTINNLLLTGADAGNYILNGGATSYSGSNGVITAAPLTLAATGATRVYDGTTGSATGPIVTGLQGNDSVSGLFQAYDNRHVGTGKTLSIAAGYTVNDDNGGGNYIISELSDSNGVITAAPLTLTASPYTRTYDGSTASAATPTVSGLMGADSVSGLDQVFSDRNAGIGKTLSVIGGYTVNDGNGGNNYQVTLVDNTAGVITPAALTLTAASHTRSYDGTTGAAATPTVSGLFGSDTVSGLTQAYTTPHAGINKSLAVTGYTVNDGNGGNNYIVSLLDDTSGVITRAGLTLSAAGSSKTYDGSILAAGTPAVSGLFGSDTVSGLTASYDNQHVGTGKTVSVNTGYTINDGNGGNNYLVSLVDSTTGVITPAQLTLAAGASSKTYDGTLISAGLPTVSGLQGSDTVTGLTQSYADKNAGTGKTLVLSGYVVNDGNGGANYIVNVSNSNLGVITPAPLTISAAANTKVYDATTSAAAAPTVTGLIGSDTLVSAIQAYANRHVGSGKTLQVTGFVLSDGNGGNNYLVNLVSNTNGVITPAPIVVMAPDNVEKLFDGSTSVPAGRVPRIVSGNLGEGVHSAVLAYDTPDVGTGKTVNIGNVVMNDGNGGLNYAVTTMPSTTGIIRDASSVLRDTPMSELLRDAPEQSVDVAVSAEGCSDGCAIQLSDLRAQLPGMCSISSVGGAGMSALPAGISFNPATGTLRFASASGLPSSLSLNGVGCNGKPQSIRMRLSGTAAPGKKLAFHGR